jgi:hypothetical protein
MEQFKKHIETEEEIGHHKIEAHTRNQNQIRLATELFEDLLNTKINFTDRDQRNEAMEYWAEKGYSKAYRELEESEVFKNHPRLQGDIFKITIQDVIEFLETGTLPE